MGTLVVFLSWLLWAMVQWTWNASQSLLSDTLISFPSNVYPEVGLLDHVAHIRVSYRTPTFWNCGGWLSSLCKMLSSCLMLKSARKQLAREDGCKCGWRWTSGDPQYELWSSRGWTETPTVILASDFSGLGVLLGPFFNEIKMRQGGCGKVLAAAGTVTASHRHAESGQRINTRAPRKGATSRPPSKPASTVLSGPRPKLPGMELREMSFGLAKPTHCKATTRGQDWDCMEPTGLTPVNSSEPSRPQKNSTSLYSGLLSLLLGFPGGPDSKESTCNEGDLGLTPGLGRSPGEGKDSPLQYSGLENSMDHIVHGIAESDMTEQLSLNFSWGFPGGASGKESICLPM